MAQLTGVWAEQAAAVTGPPPPSSISKRVAPEKPANSAPSAQDAEVAAAENAAKAQAPSSSEALKAAARQIETYLKSTGRELEFRVDEDSGRTVVSVRDAHTGELIRQIPNEETLRLARALGTQPNVLIDLFA